MRILTKQITEYESQNVELAGWVDVRRAHGKILFLDLRDRSGVAQLVFTPGNKTLYEKAELLRPEWVIRVYGMVNRRPEGMQNANFQNGHHEVLVTELEVVSEALTPPFAIETDGYDVGEEIRMQYRYLDLRRKRLQKNLRVRANVLREFSSFLAGHDFVEVETPDLTRSTPEGARDDLVPSRLYPGQFYALPQSPQQYKQLLMVAGLERYFQMAKCFRDEDTRGDRQPEFTQLDIEMSFIEESELMDLIQEMMTSMLAKYFPDKHFDRTFTIVNYRDVMEQYKTDKPDLRKDKNNPHELAFLWVMHFPLFEYSKEEKRLVSTHHPFTAPETADIELLEKSPEKVMARAYDLVLNGYEVGGGSIRINNRELQERVFKALGLKKETYEAEFGHLLQAFDYGAPAHGGIAIGIDRLLAILLGEPNIREVIAFPKTGDGRDLMMQAPSEVSKEQLDELGIQVKQHKQQ